MKKLTDQVTLRHGAVLNNRIVQPPMLTNSGANDGYVTEDTINYYAARSQSAGMVIVEYSYVSFAGGPSRSWADDREQTGFYNDSYIEGMSKVAEVLKKDGNKAIIQLAHSGRESNWRAKQGEKVYAPSKFDFGFLDYEVEEMTEADIQAVIDDFAAAAVRAVKCGFDGIEIHGANHYLLQQFFSAWSNRRDDQWGGDLAGRMKFILEICRAVFKALKDVAPDDFIIGYRLSPEEIHGDNVGYSYQEAQELVKALVDEFEFDYIHLSLPKYDVKPEGQDQTYADLFKPLLSEPMKLIIVGDVMTEEAAQDALNYTDLVAVGRATLIDPEFGLKISEGRGDEIIHEISPDQVKKSHLTPGLINLFSDPNMYPCLPGRESIYHLHQAGSLDKSVLKDGTGSAYNLDELEDL
ncbi:NADH-dependent oxidoreductase [Aerococcus urinaehominis]|uniref:NADH-dependent oxidoreductase n=1 Tax=Aerococcus urinaehominis TaxID=128944 RepID=A0A0X8FMQ4_9LACT|nr:NADH-dependent oxidoreductase [Aerococcus urinaehominis]AMB99919.1 NADH-dependent oxidoreductase [Aerococcus urinaehominis]SDM43442.1 2,4-dienoyl-CoA reductase [Aerococcus urinaehominis]